MAVETTLTEKIRATKDSIARLEAEKRDLPGQYDAAVANADATRMVAAKRRMLEVGEELSAARIALQKLDVARFDQALQAHLSDPGRGALEAEMRAAQAEYDGAKSAMAVAEDRWRRAQGAIQANQLRGESLQMERHSAERQLQGLVRKVQMAGAREG